MRPACGCIFDHALRQIGIGGKGVEIVFRGLFWVYDRGRCGYFRVVAFRFRLGFPDRLIYRDKKVQSRFVHQPRNAGGNEPVPRWDQPFHQPVALVGNLGHQPRQCFLRNSKAVEAGRSCDCMRFVVDQRRKVACLAKPFDDARGRFVTTKRSRRLCGNRQQYRRLSIWQRDAGHEELHGATGHAARQPDHHLPVAVHARKARRCGDLAPCGKAQAG